MTLPDRYASGFALWRAEHPRSRATRWVIPRRPRIAGALGGGLCVACELSAHFTRSHIRDPRHERRCPVIYAINLRAACVRWLAALPAIDADAEEWLRALPQQDIDVVVVARAEVERVAYEERVAAVQRRIDSDTSAPLDEWGPATEPPVPSAHREVTATHRTIGGRGAVGRIE